MSGLVGYGSSDEEDESSTLKSPICKESNPSGKSNFEDSTLDEDNENSHENHSGRTSITVPLSENGISERNRNYPQTSDCATNGQNDEESNSISDARTIIRNLTLPTVPNLDIPGSPPGSPPAAMNDKIKRFLELKQQGVHFNEKLASSSSLKNPSLLGKLSAFAGLDPSDQYVTSLPIGLWNPQGFPPWAFKDELAKAQQQAAKSHNERIGGGLRPGVEFVRAAVEVSLPSRESVITQQVQSKHDIRQEDGPQNHRRRSRSPDRRNKR